MEKISHHQKIIARNNHSVSLIAEGQYAVAIQELSTAMATLKRTMKTETEQGKTRTVTQRSSLDRCMIHSLSSFAPRTETDEYTSDNEYLYHQSIFIPPEYDTTCCEASFLSCVIVFNLALCHHLSAQYCADNTQARSFLRSASHIYDLCIKLNQNSQFQETSVLFSATVANNLGLVARRLGDVKATDKCFQYVLSILMLLTDYSQYHGKMSPLPSQLEGFFVNVAQAGLLSQPIGAAAA